MDLDDSFIMVPYSSRFNPFHYSQQGTGEFRAFKALLRSRSDAHPDESKAHFVQSPASQPG